MKKNVIKNMKDEKSNNNRIFEKCGILGFKDRLQTIMQGQSGNAFAKKVGMSEAVIRDYLYGRSFPSLSRAALIADRCEVPLDWLVTGKGESNPNMHASQPIVMLPICHETDNAEQLSNNPSALHLETLPFSHDWLKSRGLKPQDLFVYWAQGDSMSPTIESNNALFINRKQQQPLDGCIYLIRYGSHFSTKRLQVRAKSLILLSDNEAYPPINIDLATDLNDFAIIGRVTYILKELH